MWNIRSASSSVAVTVGTVVILCSSAGTEAAQAGSTASVKGAVTFEGEVPAPKMMLITKNNETCGTGQREIAEVSTTAEGRLRDVVVFVDGKIEGAAPPNPPESYELLQQGCRFQPYVFYVPKGETLKIVNGDPVAHNIHTYELIGRARRDLFNFSQPHEGHTKELKIKPRRGNVVQLTCDIHDFMAGWIFVPENPFAVVATEGTFLLEGIPPGARTIKVFHPTLGFQEKQVNLVAGETVDIHFVYPASQ